MSDNLKDGLSEKSPIKNETLSKRDNPGQMPKKPKSEKVSKGGKSFTIK
jgi:hypothetical protein